MSDDTPTQRFPSPGDETPTQRMPQADEPFVPGAAASASRSASGAPTSSPSPSPEGRSRALIIALIAIGVVLVAAIVVLVLLLTSRGDAPAAAGSPSPSPSTSGASQEPEPSDTPSSGTGGGTSSAPSAPPAAAGPAISYFSTGATIVTCESPNDAVELDIGWSTSGGNQVFFGIDTDDAATAPYYSDLPAIGTSGDFPQTPFDFTCSAPSHRYTITVVDSATKKKTSQTISVSSE